MFVLISTAFAQGWDVEPLFTGVDFAGDQGDVATAIALTGDPDSGLLAFAFSRQLADGGGGRLSQLFLGTIDCPGWTSCPAPTIVPVGDAVASADPLPAIAIETAPGLGPLLHVVHAQQVATSCTPDVRWLFEDVYDPATGGFETIPIREPVGCADAQLSFTAVAEDLVWACWTEDPPALTQDNQVWCGTRDLTTPGSEWINDLEADGVLTRDHSWFTILDGVRYTVLRNTDPAADAIDLVVDGVSASLPDGAATLSNDHPSVARAADGSLHAVWLEGGSRISYAKCAAGCDQSASWKQQPRPVRLAAVGRPEIAISADNRMFVFWVEDHDPTAADQWRIHVKEKCLTDSMFSVATNDGDLVSDIGASPDDQTLLLGRPRVFIDESTSTVHLGIVTKDTVGPEPAHGDAFWASKRYDPCP